MDVVNKTSPDRFTRDPNYYFQLSDFTLTRLINILPEVAVKSEFFPFHDEFSFNVWDQIKKSTVTMANNMHRYYFIDATCDTNAWNATRDVRSFDFFVQTAQRWARRAVERLQDNNDTDFARVFNVIFKARKNDRTPLPRPHRWQSRMGYQSDRDWATTFEHVVNVLSDFGNNWRRTDNREEASLRFFSDNRRRWLNGGPDPASQQDRRYDPVNHVWFMGNVAALEYGQAVGSDGIPGSEQFPHFHPDARQHARRENPKRYVIDISNNAWNEFHDWDEVLGSRGAIFSNVAINDIITGSMTRLYVPISRPLLSCDPQARPLNHNVHGACHWALVPCTSTHPSQMRVFGAFHKVFY